MNKKLMGCITIGIFLIAIFGLYRQSDSALPIVAIANYGPHASLEATIKGFKEQMKAEGFIENKNIRYEIADVGFDSNLISQMLTTLKAKQPKVMMVMTTPVAQAAKGKIQDIPLIYSSITDPVEAGLIKEPYKSHENMIGSSDKQNLDVFLAFAKSILPHAKKIGVLYAPSESNDVALVKMMRESALKFNMKIVALPIAQARDVAMTVQQFKDKVDLIYVGTSGPIQPTLPAIAAAAYKMQIPVFNVESQAVRDGLAVASFGVNYIEVGRNAGKLAVAILRGKKVQGLKPVYPEAGHHHGVINKKLAENYSISLPHSNAIELVE